MAPAENIATKANTFVMHPAGYDATDSESRSSDDIPCDSENRRFLGTTQTLNECKAECLDGCWGIFGRMDPVNPDQAGTACWTCPPGIPPPNNNANSYAYWVKQAACLLGSDWCTKFDDAGVSVADQSKITNSDGAWRYDGTTTRVGMGTYGQPCDSAVVFCAGGATWGTGDQQAEAVNAAIENGGIHPNAPLEKNSFMFMKEKSVKQSSADKELTQVSTVAGFVSVHLHGIGEKEFPLNKWAGTKGQNRRLEGFQIYDLGEGLSIECMAHVQGSGDTGWTSGYVGTKGQSRRLEGFAIRIKGKASYEWSVLYSAQIHGYDETPTVSDGAFCGTRGQSRQVEAILINIVKKKKS